MWAGLVSRRFRCATPREEGRRSGGVEEVSTTTSKQNDGSEGYADDVAFLEQQATALRSEREKYVRSADVFKAEADALAAEREPGDVQFDEESGEGDSLAVERERDLALSAQARAAVEQIDAALGRIDDRTYGICVTSGLTIPRERLEAIPWASERVEVKAGGLGRR